MYKYNENSLIHSVGVDFSAIDSVMNNGIVSEKYGKEHGININRNYYGSNLDDTISCIRYLYVNKDDPNSAYNRYVPNGISFIIEDTPFISDKSERFIHRSDEVLVEDYIPKENIKGILVPDVLMSADLEDLTYIREDSSSYDLVKYRVDSIINYIYNLSGISCNYDNFMWELSSINKTYKSASKEDQEDMVNQFKDAIIDLNYEIGFDFKKCFSKVIGKSDINICDIIEFINSKSLNLPIYITKDRSLNKGKNI